MLKMSNEALDYIIELVQSFEMDKTAIKDNYRRKVEDLQQQLQDNSEATRNMNVGLTSRINDLEEELAQCKQ